MERRPEGLTGWEVARSAGCIAVSGEIDVANASEIEQRITALLGDEPVTLDCRGVTFLDVAGLRMLAHVGLAAAAAGTIVRLLCSPAVAGTLTVCCVCELPGMVLDRDHPGSLR